MASHPISNPFKEASIAVVGDAMLDVYWQGSVHRQTPEDKSVPVISDLTKQTQLGGALGVVANTASLGGTCLFTGRIGIDEGAENICAIFEKQELATDYLIIEPTTPTTRKIRLNTEGAYIARIDDESTAPLNPASLARLKERLTEMQSRVEWLVLSDYGKGVLTTESIKIIKEIWPNDKILADPKTGNRLDYDHIFCLKPNLKEAAWLLEKEEIINTDSTVTAAAEAIIKRYNTQIVLLTRDRLGLTLVQKGKDPLHIPGRAGNIKNVSGAGDSVMAAFALSLAAGLSLEDAANYAELAGSIAVEQPQTTAVTWDEMAAKLSSAAA